jgi:hypothetical protein
MTPCTESLHTYAQCDPGANISATPHLDLLSDGIDVSPLSIDEADSHSVSMTSSSAGWFLLSFCNSPPQRIFMRYCPDFSMTVVSPQHACLPWMESSCSNTSPSVSPIICQEFH